MELENGSFIASSGFEYSGIPTDEMPEILRETYDQIALTDTEKIIENLGIAFTITQTLILLFTLVCIIKAVVVQINNKKVVAPDVIENSDEESKKVKKENPIVYYTFAAIMLIGYGLIEIVRGLLGN